MKTEIILEKPYVKIEKFYDGEKEVAWQKFGVDSGNWVLLESEGQIPDGVVKEYYETGKVHYERNFKNGKRHGLVKEFYQDGTLRSETKYVDGKKYESSGVLKKGWTFKDDLSEGISEMSNQKGKK